MARTKRKHPELKSSEVVAELPAACADEAAAVDFMERKRWGGCPACVNCGSVDVYRMRDIKTGERNKRFLWRCRDCKKQFTVRIGTVFEESRLPLRHWCYAFWRVSTSKKGVSALEIKRHCQINYQSALFLLHRVRWAMAPANAEGGKLTGTVECDETYVGGKPRPGSGEKRKTGRGTSKVPVMAMVQRGGRARTRVVERLDGETLQSFIFDNADISARLCTDELPGYRKIGEQFEGGHLSVNHGRGEYVNGEASTNAAEGFFAIFKRGLYGIYHAVSRQHLHRYASEFEFRFNHRFLNDGERAVMAIRAAEGKRLVYKQT